MKATIGGLHRQYIEKTSSESLVRAQNYVDDDIPSDLAQLWSKIVGAKNILNAHHKNVELYSRSWTGTDEIVEERGGDSTSCFFTAAQFNALAKGLSAGPNNLFPTPFEKDSALNDGNYGGFTALTKPEIVMDFDHVRKWRLLEVILGGGLNKNDGFIADDGRLLPAYDILAMEEIDEYYSFFEPILVKNGCYCGIYQPKPYSPCVRFGWYSDGVVLLWNKEKFKAIDKCIHGDFNNSETWVVRGSFKGGAEYQNQVHIVVPLQIIGSNKCVVVAATHLKAKKGETKGVPNEKIREAQAIELRRLSEQLANQLKCLGWKDVSILILGDFNSDPDSACVRTILCEKGDWNFQSAYEHDGEYTTWKTRKDGTTRRVIDYIFHAGDGLHCKQVLSIPSDKELEKTHLPGFCYPSDHLLIAGKFQYHVTNNKEQNEQIQTASNSPFEWLTNFQSLRHLLLPSSIVFGRPSVGNESHERCLKLNALHVGCGTSTVAESLMCLQEKTFGYHLQYGYCLNVDIDQGALDVMQHRWKQRQGQTQQLDDIIIGVMDWKYLDFQCEKSCRSALDQVYRDLTQSSSNTSNDFGGCFDLVLDKSTLDCLLCSETDVVAGFLCEVYRALRAPTSESKSDAIDLDELSSESGTTQRWWGGVYVLITFHPVEFIKQLLTYLPGAYWEITSEVIKRKADVVNTIDALEVDEVTSKENDSEVDAERCLPPISSAWASGCFIPDENYRKTITVVTCRRSSNPKHELLHQRYTLDRQLVREHVENTCNKWYQTTNQMVTIEREAKLRLDFERAFSSERKQAESLLIRADVTLDLKTCYEILFTEEEKQVLPYDYFIEDWEAYCGNQGDDFLRHRMSIDTALDFLKEMQ